MLLHVMWFASNNYQKFLKKKNILVWIFSSCMHDFLWKHTNSMLQSTMLLIVQFHRWFHNGILGTIHPGWRLLQKVWVTKNILNGTIAKHTTWDGHCCLGTCKIYKLYKGKSRLCWSVLIGGCEANESNGTATTEKFNDLRWLNLTKFQKNHHTAYLTANVAHVNSSCNFLLLFNILLFTQRLTFWWDCWRIAAAGNNNTRRRCCLWSNCDFMLPEHWRSYT